MKKWIAGAVLALSVASVGGTAVAGEATGSGKGGPDKENPGVTGAKANASSACAFSGLEDGEEGGPAGPGETPQNWGQIPHDFREVLAAEGAHPGDACRGNVEHEE